MAEWWTACRIESVNEQRRKRKKKKKKSSPSLLIVVWLRRVPVGAFPSLSSLPFPFPFPSPPLMGRLLVSGARRFSNAVFKTVSAQSYCPQNSRRFFLSSSSFQLTPPWRSSFATATHQKNVAAVMSSSAADLVSSVEGLSLQSTTETSKFPNCYPSLNVVDVYREHIAEKLSTATDIDAEKIYSRLSWTNSLDKGDLVLPVCDIHHKRFTLGSNISWAAKALLRQTD